MRRIDRRDFAKEASLAFLSGVTVTISSACGGGGGGGYSSGTPTSGSPTTTTPPATATDKLGSISDNHGHSVVITAAQLEAGGAVTLSIEGTAGHPHMITLGADAMALIKAGRAVDTVSTTLDGHMHIVAFNSQSGEPPTRY